MLRSICVFSGNANVPLADAICRFIEVPRGQVKISRFSDGEIFVEVGENVRGVDAYVIQPMAKPVNDHLMELLILVDSLKRASAGSITAVIPYYGYARQDRKVAPRTPITAKLVADLLTASGVDRVLAMDLHAGQIQGFFNIPFDHLYSMPVFLEHLKGNVSSDAVIVSPDAGGVERARAYAKRLGGSIAIVDKRRERANESEVMHIVGDVRGRDAIVLDDMIDTAGTICNAANALAERGAKRIIACATHGVLSGSAIERLAAAPFEQVIVSDTLPISTEARALSKLKVLSVSRILGEAIKRIHHSDSVSSLFV